MKFNSIRGLDGKLGNPLSQFSEVGVRGVLCDSGYGQDDEDNPCQVAGVLHTVSPLDGNTSFKNVWFSTEKIND